MTTRKSTLEIPLGENGEVVTCTFTVPQSINSRVAAGFTSEFTAAIFNVADAYALPEDRKRGAYNDGMALFPDADQAAPVKRAKTEHRVVPVFLGTVVQNGSASDYITIHVRDWEENHESFNIE